MQVFFVMAVALLTWADPASAQQSTPSPVKLLLKNEQIDVKELRLRPGEKLPQRDFPNSFVYALTDGALVFAHPGKTPFEMTFRSGDALWLPSQAATAANESAKDVRVLIVEIRQHLPARRSVKTKQKAKAKAKLQIKPKAAAAAPTRSDAKTGVEN